MEILATIIGVGVVAVSPFVAVLRPAAKTAVKGALAVSDAVVGTVAIVSHQVHKLVPENKAETEVETVAEAGTSVAVEGTDTPVENIPVSNEDTASSKGAVSSVTSAVGAVAGAVAGAAVKGSLGVADKAKGAAAATGKQLSNLTKGKTAADTAVMTEIPVEEADSPTPTNDDLALIKGIGPKSAELLHAAGITTFAQLAATNEANLRQILSAAGGRFKVIDPSSWPEQAQQMSEAA